MSNIGETICGPGAIAVLKHLAMVVRGLEGDVVEVGVYKGGSALMLSKELPDDKLYLFDTFDGMPEANIELDNFHRKGDFGDTSFEWVSELFAGNPNVSVYRGCFPRDNSEVLEGKKFKLVHLDVDIYSSYKECLAYFHNKMVPQGIMVFDDYNAPSCLGAKKAIDEYVAEHGLQLSQGGDCQTFIVY
jgi:O-methyltransferase